MLMADGALIDMVKETPVPLAHFRAPELFQSSAVATDDSRPCRRIKMGA